MSTIDTSGIDATKPTATSATTSSVRDNFTAIIAQFTNAASDIDGIVSGSTALTNVDINSGNIDGTIIGASSAAAGTFAALTATGAFTSLGIDDNATTNQLTITDTASTFGGNVSLGDSKYLYLGAGNDLSLSHNGSATNINNSTGQLLINELVNSTTIALKANNSAGTLKTCAEFGGATPNCDFYGDGVVHFSTKASSTYRTINFASIPTSATGLSAGDVWSNGGVLTIV